MKLTIEIDEAQLPKHEGKLYPETVLMAIAGDPAWFFKSADEVSVEGTFGKFTEVRA